MATQDFAASVQGVAVRVTRLTSTGALMTGPTDNYTTTSFIRVTFTPEYDTGDEFVEKSANGTICVTYKAPDTLKRITMEIAICEPDPEFSALVSGGLLLTRQGTVGDDATIQSVGWATPLVGEDPSGNGVAVEVWSYAVQGGKKASTNPYYQWVFPYVKLSQSGDRVIENGMLATTFSGYGLGNINFQTGPDGRWDFPAATDRPYSYARTSWAPVGYKGMYTWDATTPGEGTPVQMLPVNNAGINIAGTTGYNPASPTDAVLQSGKDTADTGVPIVTAVSPANGGIAGGTNVTITGTNFIGATAVTFGGTAATKVNVVTDSKITATAPAHAAGLVAVAVTTPDGTGSLASGFTYA